MAYGISGSFCMVIATMLVIYATTYGLAGPASAMVQCQGLVHTLISAFVLGQIPSCSVMMGMCFAICGTVIMGFDIPCFKEPDINSFSDSIKHPLISPNFSDEWLKKMYFMLYINYNI